MPTQPIWGRRASIFGMRPELGSVLMFALAGVRLNGADRSLLEKAQAGDMSAQVDVGNMYADGNGVTKDSAEAVKWYQKAADRGFAPAEYDLGLIVR